MDFLDKLESHADRTLVMGDDEMCIRDRYKSYFPSTIHSIDDILRLARLKRSDIDFSKQPTTPPPEIHYPAPKAKAKLRDDSTRPLRVLYVDTTQFFSTDDNSESVSYTHLDVYKRQVNGHASPS